GEIIVDDQRVLALLVHIVLGHGATGVRGVVLKGRWVGRRRGDHDGVIHGAGGPQVLDDLGHGRFLLADRDVDADYAALLLVDDGVYRDGGLAGLAVADDEFPLAPPDGRHGVDGLDARLQGNVHRLALGHAGGGELDRPAVRRHHRSLVVQRYA